MIRRAMSRVRNRRQHSSAWEQLSSQGVVSAGVGTYGTEGVKVHEFRLPDGAWVGSKLRIGKYCSLAPFEVFLGGNHHYEYISQYPFRSICGLSGRNDDAWNAGDVTLGNDV